MQELKRKLYEDCLKDGAVQVSPKAKYEPKWIELQVKCEHAYEELRRGANGTSVYATCGACGLKSAICYRRKTS